MAKTPYEALDDHTKYEGAHQLDEHWELIAANFRKQERAILKNAIDLRNAIAALTERFEHHTHDSLKTNCDNQHDRAALRSVREEVERRVGRLEERLGHPDPKQCDNPWHVRGKLYECRGILNMIDAKLQEGTE